MSNLENQWVNLSNSVNGDFKNIFDNLKKVNEVIIIKTLIRDFVRYQGYFSINKNGKIERNNIVREFKEYCYIHKETHSFKNDEVIELVKDEYYRLSESKLSKKEFFESLKPQVNKHKW